MAAAIAGSLLLVAQPALADATSDRIADLERKLERSMQVIEQLSRKVEQLEAGRAASPAPATSAAPSPTGIEARIIGLEQQVSAIGNRSTLEDGLALRGFADVGLRASRGDRRRGAALGNVDLYLTPQFGNNVKSLIELVFETGEDGALSTDLERLQVGYTFNDALTVWLGRFHTPYGYWNTAFHHGAQIQASILRPRFLEFEDRGGILPSHGVGAWALGKFNAGGGRVNYDLYLANSPRITLEDPTAAGTGVLDPNLAGSTNHNALVGGKLGYDFGGALDGLTLGVHAFTMKIEDDAATPRRTRVRMAGGYGTWLADNWEVLGEYYRFSNRNLSGITGAHHAWAGYLQAGRSFGRWTPYARVERASLDQGDNYFAQQASGQSYRRGVFGLRFDLDPRSALKFELNRTRFDDRATSDSNEARFQYAIRF